MHFAQTKTFLACPPIIIRIFCRLGRNLRLVQRLILLPVPPLLLYWPFRVTFLPVCSPFLQIAHFFNIIYHSFTLDKKYTGKSDIVKEIKLKLYI